jgi:hypothetical protein
MCVRFQIVFRYSLNNDKNRLQPGPGKKMCAGNAAECLLLLSPNSLYIHCAVSNFYETEIEIWTGLGPVSSTEKNGPIMSATF